MGKNLMKLDTTGFGHFASKLNDLGANLKTIFTDAMEQAGETIGNDTEDAMGKLPAGGRYETGRTRSSIARKPKVEWSGPYGSIGVGFDFNKPGAGGYLITGTPKMKPVARLNRMYKGKSYMKEIQSDMEDIFADEVSKRMGG